MKTLLRSTFLFIAFAITHFSYGQLTKLSNNTNLTGFVVNNKPFLGSDVDHTLWTTNGTPASTVQFTDKVIADSTDNGGIVLLGGKIYFSGTDATHGSELWVTDGTDAGTALVKDIEPGAVGSTPSDFFILNNLLLFVDSTAANGTELWKTDGTEAGTVLVKDIAPGTASSAPGNFFLYNNQLFFVDSTAANGTELWKTDGTEGGTVLIKDINPGPKGSIGGPLLANHFVNNGILYFVANDGTHGSELWKTDGNEAGTVMVKDINPGAGNGIGGLFGGFTNFFGSGTLTLFTADDGSTGTELWKTDGTEGGTVLVKDINPSVLPSSPASFITFNNKILFTATTVTEGMELWTTDGTTAGTTIVKDINPGAAPSAPFLAFYTIFGNKIIFTATDADYGDELWSTDGTPGGTTLLKDINRGKKGSGAFILPNFQIANLSLESFHTPGFNGKAFLMAQTQAEGRELWITDGTEAGTVLVKDIYKGDEDGFAGGFYFYTQNAFFFEGKGSEALGDELWRSDGTPTGPSLVQDINPGAGSSDIAFSFVFNNHIYLNANDGDNTEDLTDLYILDESVTLPVSLFNFAATVQPSKAVKLNWTTTNEINSSHFAIERSADGVQFNNIDKVNAAGNSSLQQQYQYVDPQPAHLSNPILFYRLKMVDKDGSHKYSRVLAVHFKESSFRFTFSPNPVQNQLSIVVSAGSSKSIALRITDISGKQVYQQTLSSSQNIAQQNVNVAGWQKGIYVIQLITDRSIKTARFVKQ